MQLKEASILVVDDEPVLLEILSAWFQRLAGRVFSAAQGAEALQILDSSKIDLIVTDVRMPVMDGIALLKKVKANGLQTPHVVLITGFSDIDEREAYDLGAEALLEKPIERDDLIHAVKKSLTERNDLWRMPLELGACPVLTGSFESLNVALQEQKITFGRGGFGIETNQLLAEGPVEIELNFRSDHFRLLGQGIVRWLALPEARAGIEFTYVAEQSRGRVIQLTDQSVAFIPCMTERAHQAGAR